MKIGFVTHWFDPEVGSASFSGTIARALRRDGDSIRVLTGFPIYPAGEVYAGYSLRPYMRDEIKGTDVRRSVIYPSHDRSVVRRFLNYASFAVSGSLTGLITLRDRDANLVFCSPATATAPAWVVHKVWGVPYVLHIQDLWPDSVLESGFLHPAAKAIARHLLNGFLTTMYRDASHVAVTSPSMADALVSRGVPEGKISVVPNWADEESFRPVSPDPALAQSLGLTAPHVVMYAGNMGEVQGLDSVVMIAEDLRDRQDIQFVLVGDGVARPRLERMVAEKGLTNVAFVPPQPFEEMRHILALSSVQIVSLIDSPLFAMTLPSKLQATLASGKPVLGLIAGDGARLIEQARAGRAVAPGDHTQAAADLAELTADPHELETAGRRGRDYYLAHLSEEAGAGALLARLREAARSR